MIGFLNPTSALRESPLESKNGNFTLGILPINGRELHRDALILSLMLYQPIILLHSFLARISYYREDVIWEFPLVFINSIQFWDLQIQHDFVMLFNWSCTSRALICSTWRKTRTPQEQVLCLEVADSQRLECKEALFLSYHGEEKDSWPICMKWSLSLYCSLD